MKLKEAVHRWVNFILLTVSIAKILIMLFTGNYELKEEFKFLEMDPDFLELRDTIELDKVVEKYSVVWDKQFKLYYESHVENAVLTSAKWVLLKYGLYKTEHGLTTNISEGMNNLFKMMNSYKEIPLDCAIVCFNNLQVYYSNEIKRGCAQMGELYIVNCFYCKNSNYAFYREL